MKRISKPNPELAKKIKAAKEEWQTVEKELDEKGLLIKLHRAGFKNYNVIVNFEIRKNYRQRRSAKRYIRNLLTN